MAEIQMRIRYSPMWGSHLPVLMALIKQTSGTVFELGSGIYSTPFLHWACFEARRELITFEADKEWAEALISFHGQQHRDRRFHHFVAVADWDTVDLSGDCNVALVDHDVAERRYKEVLKLTHADFVIAHDAGDRAAEQGYDKIGDAFRYKFCYRRAYPNTAILSNSNDPREYINPRYLREGV